MRARSPILARARRIRGFAALAAAAAVAAAVPSIAAADPPTRITIVSVFDPIDFGENAYVNGQVFQDTPGGQVVTLEQAAAPFTEWATVAQVTTDPEGYYSFELHPTQTLMYRTNSQGASSERAVNVSVLPRISFRAVRAGRASVRFSGTFAPAVDGQRVAIQRRTTNGSWATVAKAALRSGTTFQGQIRTSHPLTLRAAFANNGALATAASRAVTVVVGHG
jgi:hypothetical protein